jgi:hypothetical protein
MDGIGAAKEILHWGGIVRKIGAAHVVNRRTRIVVVVVVVVLPDGIEERRIKKRERISGKFKP